MSATKFVFRILMAMLFIVFFGFALKNTQEVGLRFFLDYEVRGPLVILLLIFFVAGFCFGVLAMTPVFFRQRRDLIKQQKINQSNQFNQSNQTNHNIHHVQIHENDQVHRPPQPDGV